MLTWCCPSQVRLACSKLLHSHFVLVIRRCTTHARRLAPRYDRNKVFPLDQIQHGVRLRIRMRRQKQALISQARGGHAYASTTHTKESVSSMYSSQLTCSSTPLSGPSLPLNRISSAGRRKIDGVPDAHVFGLATARS